MNIVKLTSFSQISGAMTDLKDVFFNFAGDLEKYAQKLAEHATVFECKDGKSTLGIIAFYANDKQNKIAFITAILVAANAQNRGVGKALLAKTEEFCRTSGMTAVKLEVHKENAKAISFYIKHGYEYVEDCSECTVYMQKGI